MSYLLERQAREQGRDFRYKGDLLEVHYQCSECLRYYWNWPVRLETKRLCRGCMSALVKSPRDR